MYKLHAV